MLLPAAFLEQECDNVATLLDHALRFDYGPSGSEEFYKQCQLRMEVIRKKLRDLPTVKASARPAKAKEVASLLSKLSELIAHIERAHIGEFSWACGEAFRRHATALCMEFKTDVDETDDNEAEVPAEGEVWQKEVLEQFKKLEQELRDSAKPLFFILADGGILAYRIRSWQAEVDIPTRRIFTITVPTSLRHHVLLHAVLGHELGHAAHQLPDQGEFMDQLVKNITAGSVIPDMKKLQGWKLEGFPPLSSLTKDTAPILVRYWVTEIACDLFGLVLMGPSFAGALRTLFDGFDQVGVKYGSKHPPQAWRFEALRRAYQHLGWHKAPKGMKGPIKKAFDEFTATTLNFKRTTAHEHEVFNKGVIEKAIDDLVAFFAATAKDSAYVVPKAETLNHLYSSLMKLRPPVGQQLDTATGKFLEVDYRHVMHAGWLAVHGEPSSELKRMFSTPADLKRMFSFLNKNRLCEQAIIQLEAVRIPQVEDENAGT